MARKGIKTDSLSPERGEGKGEGAKMAVVIRMKRIGTTKKQVQRIVVTDIRNPRDGRFIEEIGYYDPKRDPAIIKIDKDRAAYWLGVGAKPSEAVKLLFKKVGV